VVHILDSCFGAGTNDCVWFDPIYSRSCASVGFGEGPGEVMSGRQREPEVMNWPWPNGFEVR